MNHAELKKPLCGWVIFHGVYVPQLPYPFVCWWASRLLPCPGYDKQCCMESEVGGGIGMGNTCKPMAVSFQCMTKFTTNKKNFKKRSLFVNATYFVTSFLWHCGNGKIMGWRTGQWLPGVMCVGQELWLQRRSIESFGGGIVMELFCGLAMIVCNDSV